METPERYKAVTPTVYEARAAGREFCQTEGADHYRGRGVESLDLIIACGYAEEHCLSSIIKYAARFKRTRNLEDIKKLVDYAHILCGIELAVRETSTR